MSMNHWRSTVFEEDKSVSSLEENVDNLGDDESTSDCENNSDGDDDDDLHASQINASKTCGGSY